MSYAIIQAARAVVAEWGHVTPPEACTWSMVDLMRLLKDPDNFATEAEIQRAREEYTNRYDASIMIDDGACASHADEGVWVQAWVFLQDGTQ